MNYTQNKIFLVLFGATILSGSGYSRCHHFPPSQRNNGRYYDERYGESWRKETAEDREEYRQNKEKKREEYRQKRARKEIDRERQKQQPGIDNLEQYFIKLQQQIDKKEK